MRSRPKGQQSQKTTPPSQAVVYRGPVHVHKKDEGLLSANLSQVSAVTFTTVGGAATFNTVFTAASVTSATDWADYKALYQQFRVLAIEVKFNPKFSHNWNESTAILAGTYLSALYLAPYHGDATALTNEDSAVNHQEHSARSVDVPFSVSVKMRETDEAQWFSTTSGTAGVFGVKTLLTTAGAVAAAAIQFGSIHLTHCVEFRGRVVSATQVSSRLSISTSSDIKQSVAQDQKQIEAKEHKVPALHESDAHSPKYVLVPNSWYSTNTATFPNQGKVKCETASQKAPIATLTTLGPASRTPSNLDRPSVGGDHVEQSFTKKGESQGSCRLG